MNESRIDGLGRDLQLALGRRIARGRRRRRATVLATVAVMAFSAVAAASDDVGLHTFGLDPAEFEVLGGGRLEENAEFIAAKNKQDGFTSIFVHTRDDGLDRYKAFELHQRSARAAAASSGTSVEPGADCSADQLTRAEVVALETLIASFEPGTMAPSRADPSPHARAEAAVDEAVGQAFAGERCSGLGYAGEIALLVYAGLEPIGNLMPGARATAKRAALR
jgi:hypothetical protein